MNEIQAAFKGIGLIGAYEIRWLDYKHVLIHLTNEHDLNRLWMRHVWFIANQKMRVFKWSPDFQSEKEFSLVPIWISFPGLHAHLFEKLALLMIAKTVGRLLFVDEATANGSRPSIAWVCVEYDCQKPPLDHIWIVTRDRQTGIVTGGFVQKVEFSKLPAYCTHCSHVGHDFAACIVLGNKLERMGAMRQKPLDSEKLVTGDDKGREKDETRDSEPNGNKRNNLMPSETAEKKREREEKRLILEKKKNPKNKIILSREESTTQNQRWQVVGKACSSGANDMMGTETNLEMAPQHANVPIFNRFQTIIEAENEEQNRMEKQGQTEYVNSNHVGKKFLAGELVNAEER